MIVKREFEVQFDSVSLGLACIVIDNGKPLIIRSNDPTHEPTKSEIESIKGLEVSLLYNLSCVERWLELICTTPQDPL